MTVSCDRCLTGIALRPVTCSYGCEHNMCAECAEFTEREAAKVQP